MIIITRYQKTTCYLIRSFMMAATQWRNTNPTRQIDVTVEEKSKLWLGQLQRCMPPLTSALHKGQSGRIGIIGGCDEYTGAPHYAAMSALRCGADLVHIFCTPSAAPVLKSYGPEAIVHGILRGGDITAEAHNWLPRLHGLVLGPGLGRDPNVLESAASLIRIARNLALPLVVDADGLWMALQEPELISSWPMRRAVLTPNAAEFSQLIDMHRVATVEDLAESFSATVVLKGKIDYAATPEGEVIVCGKGGSGRRCGGQGDLLSGALGLFLSWACRAQDRSDDAPEGDPTLMAAYAACRMARECNMRAFGKRGRSTLTMDMLAEIHDAFDHLFEESGGISNKW